MTAKERNAAARKRAEADRESLLKHAKSDDRTRDKLDGLMGPDIDSVFARVASAIKPSDSVNIEWVEASVEGWRAWWSKSIGVLDVDVKRLQKVVQAIREWIAQKLIDLLAKTPEAPDSMSGATLLTALVESMPPKAEWDERRHVNLPAPLANTRYVAVARQLHDGQIALPLDYDELQTTIPVREPRFEVGYLPTLEPEPSKLVPSPLLNLWDACTTENRSGPVALPRRIGLEVLLSVPPDARTNDAVLLETTIGQLWKTVSPRTDYRPGTHGEPLLEALRVVHTGKVAWGDSKRGAMRVLVAVRDWPNSFDRHDRLAFDVRLPPGSRQGAQVDRAALRFVLHRCRQHRLLLTAYCLFDRYGTVKGRLIAPTQPVVRRAVDSGYVIDVHGEVVAEKGAPTRRATHKHAVQTGAREPNPEARRRYPVLVGSDLILCGYSYVARTPEGRRNQRNRVLTDAAELGVPVSDPPKKRASNRQRPALLHVEAVTSDGATLLPTHGGGWHDRGKKIRSLPERCGLRVMPDLEYLHAHAARWAAHKHGSTA